MTGALLLLLVVAVVGWARLVRVRDRVTLLEAGLFAVACGSALGLAAGLVT